MESSEFFSTVERMHVEARRRGLFFQSTESDRTEGRHLVMHGRDCLAFASCSYLGLERHPALIKGVHDFVERYGTQFSTSRGYVALRAHSELEAALDEIFDGFSLLATSTTLVHQIALPVLASERDAIVMDHQIHHSVHMAATLARAAGTQVEIVRHGRLADAVEIVERLARTKRKVWFACDGVFSMFGDLAPLTILQQVLAIAPNVHLYIDDAHGMSWAGRHGRGSFLSRMPPHERLVVATSLNKAFSASGGCVVLPTNALREQIRLSAGPIVFSGPIQPPMLGAALASAEVHLSSEIGARQALLAARVGQCNRRAKVLGLPLLAENESPIFFFRCGLPRVAYAVAERLLERGLYVTPSTYPSVPMKTAGIRLSLTTEHSVDDIEGVLVALAEAIPWALESEHLSAAERDLAFVDALPPESRGGGDHARKIASGRFIALSYAQPETNTRSLGGAATSAQEIDPSRLAVQIETTIRAIDRDFWDLHMGTVSCSSWEAMATAEEIFQGHPAEEDNWTFRYVIVRDETGELLAMTYFTVMLSKDDMLMRTAVSNRIEAYRRSDPYFLTSQVVSMGSGFSEGSHLYLRRSGPWRAALTCVLSVALDEYESRGAGLVMLRDFADDDVELADFLLDSGFIRVPMLDSHILEVTWKSPCEFEARLSRRRRRQLREVQRMTPSYERRVLSAAVADDDAHVDHLYQLYRNVAERKLRLNTFPLPRSSIPGILRSPAWELVTLHLAPEAGGPEDDAPVAWVGAHHSGDHYMPLLCGLDYAHVYEHGAYRQLLYQIVLRAEELGIGTIHLGMDADYEKERFRTTRVKTSAFVHSRDDFVGARMREVVAEVGLKAK